MKLWLLLEMQWAISWAASGAEPLAVDGEAGLNGHVDAPCGKKEVQVIKYSIYIYISILLNRT